MNIETVTVDLVDKNQEEVQKGEQVVFQAQVNNEEKISSYELEEHKIVWFATRGTQRVEISTNVNTPLQAPFDTGAVGVTGDWKVTCKVDDKYGCRDFTIKTPPVTGPSVDVTLQRAGVVETADQALWVVIRKSTNLLSYDNYENFIDAVMCGKEPSEVIGDPDNSECYGDNYRDLQTNRALPYSGVDAYRKLKVATEVFMMCHCGVALNRDILKTLAYDTLEETRRFGKRVETGSVEGLWTNYLTKVNGIETIPYLKLIRSKLKDLPFKDTSAENCYGILLKKLTNPCLLELIWSYWMEEGLQVQTINAINLRFQNRRGARNPDPLAHIEIGPLRLLNNLLWGYIQDEQHRLTMVRRSYEYDHHYGIHLDGKAVPTLRPVDSRSRFIEAYHNLLHLCSLFYKEDDDTTIIADGFSVLNALKEVHLLLTQNAHNQYGELPSTSRQEMLMEQWLLARPEMREFLPSRVMVDYPEPWMDRVEAMKKLQGWSETPITHFRDLAVFGEQILLGIRFGAWSKVNDPASGANWARYWRPEIQNYIHSYRAATGVDLTAETTETRLAGDAYLPPAMLLRRREGTAARSAQPTRSRPVQGGNGRRGPRKTESEFAGGYRR